MRGPKNNDQHHQEKFSSSWRSGALMAGNVALAADVPAGVTLAKNKRWYVTMVQKFSH